MVIVDEYRRAVCLAVWRLWLLALLLNVLQGGKEQDKTIQGDWGAESVRLYSVR